MIAKNLNGSLSAERQQEVVKVVCDTFANIALAPDNEGKLAAFAELLGKIPDVLALPVIRRAMAVTFLMAEEAETLTAPQLAMLRQAAGITQPELARRLGVSQGNVADWERGSRPIPRRHVSGIRSALSAQIAA